MRFQLHPFGIYCFYASSFVVFAAYVAAGCGKEPVAPIWWSLYDWAILNGYEEETKQIVKGLFYHNEAMTLTEPLVRALYAPAGQIIGSVTRFESYRQCPFAYFARYGLGLEERPVQSFSAPDLGTLVHEALRRIGDDLLQAGRQWSDIEKDDIPTLCTAVVDDLSPKIQNDILVSNAYFVQIKGRLIQVLIRTVDRLRQFKSVSSFVRLPLNKALVAMHRCGNRCNSGWIMVLKSS